MKKLTFILIIASIFFLESNSIFGKNLNQVISFASEKKARSFLLLGDDFTDSWSKFDIISRLKDKEGSKEQLLDYISKQALTWNKSEKKKINSVINNINKKIESNGFNLPFPDTIYLLKTTAKEEAEVLGYTRANYIVLSTNIIKRSIYEIEETLIHELFHVLTRNNPKFRKDIYTIIGFKLCNKIEYPANIADYKITNPDAPLNDSFIRLKKGNENVDCSMIIYSKKQYRSGSFFEYINVDFLVLENNENKREAKLINGEPVILSFKEVQGFFEQVGKNTRYIIHPEEILAENFVSAMYNDKNLPDQFIVNEIRKLLESF